MMRGRSRQKSFRILLSAIYDSNLTASEIFDLAKALEIGDLGRELGRALRVTSEFLGEHESPSDLKENLDRLLDMAQNIVDKRRMTKRSVYEHMRTVNRRAAGNLESQMTMREMLLSFFTEISESDAKEFVNLIESPNTLDPYVREILKRSDS